MTLPGTAEDLTPEWLTGALAPVLDGATVVDVSSSTIGTGQMSDSIRLALEYDLETSAPSSVIAKLPSSDAGTRSTGLSLRSYEIEVSFYRELGPTLPIRTPHPYFAEIEAGTPDFVLLLEDLADSRAGDQLAGCTVAQAEDAIDELVKLHAPRWGDPGLDEIEWLHRDPEGSAQMMANFLPMLWSGFTDRYDDRLEPHVVEVGSELMGSLATYFDDRTPWTVTHGDYRLDNLLLGTTPDAPPVTVVDWQTCSHGPGLGDLAYFLGAGLLPDVRREHEEQLVRRYHARMVDAGVDLSWDACWRGHRRGTVAGLIMALGASMLVERTERGDDMFMVMAERHATHALDVDALALLKA